MLISVDKVPSVIGGMQLWFYSKIFLRGGKRMNLGEKLYNLRKDTGMSQEEVADKLKVSRQTVSKWETGESKPDFDKIVPICNLFSITTDELLNGSVSESDSLDKEVVRENTDYNISNVRKTRALLISIGIFLYFVGVCCIIFCSEFGISDGIGVTLFMAISGIATGILIYQGIVYSKKEIEEIEYKVNPKKKELKLMTEIVSTIFAVIYFVISFTTMRWDITWIIWIIYAVVENIIKLLYEMRGDRNGK